MLEIEIRILTDTENQEDIVNILYMAKENAARAHSFGHTSLEFNHKNSYVNIRFCTKEGSVPKRNCRQL
jgi:hypothetical protein